MSRVCILTDSTAQFSQPDFPGRELVTVLPMRVQLNGSILSDDQFFPVGELADTAITAASPKLLPPMPDQLSQILLQLGRDFNEILVIMLSHLLNPAIQQVYQASSGIRSSANIHTIDSQTTGAGLGYLVETAASAALAGATALEIKRDLRARIPHIYSILSVKNLTYLHQSGHLDLSQALIGEMLGLLPVLIMENGQLVPIQKARSSRNLVDIFFEFAAEVGNLSQIALLYGHTGFSNETRILRERIKEDYPDITFSEHLASSALSIILGPSILGLFAIEHINGKFT